MNANCLLDMSRSIRTISFEQNTGASPSSSGGGSDASDIPRGSIEPDIEIPYQLKAASAVPESVKERSTERGSAKRMESTEARSQGPDAAYRRVQKEKM